MSDLENELEEQTDLDFLLEGFNVAVLEGDLEEALEWAEGIYYHLAWKHDPKIVATITEALDKLG